MLNNKKHLQIFFAILLILSLMFSSNSVYAVGSSECLSNSESKIVTTGASKSTTTMTKDTVYSGSLTIGSVDTYYFTPSYSGMFTVETFGSTDTYGVVSGISSSASDDDSGAGKNFAIGFYQQAGSTTTIKVQHYNLVSGTGSYTIQVRDQRAQIYTFDYGSGDISTLADSATPKSWLQSMGYAVGVHENKPASHVNATIASTFKRLNSEVFFFSGHGGKGGGSILFLTSAGTYDWMYDTSSYFTSMANTKVAVWAACNSALDPDGTGARVSIAQKSINMGAKSAIGWDRTTDVPASKKWTDQFFLELGNTMTVSAAAASAGSIFLWPWDGSYAGWQVFGDGNTVVSYSNVNPKSVASNNSTASNISTQAELDLFKQNSEYVSYELKGLGTRYYRTINGCLTNVYYDEYSDGTVKKSQENINKSDLLAVKAMDITKSEYMVQKDITAYGVSFDKLVKSEEHIVYMKDNGVIIPIKLIYSDYENSEGAVYQDVVCINLIDNSFINYEDICTINS